MNLYIITTAEEKLTHLGENRWIESYAITNPINYFKKN